MKSIPWCAVGILSMLGPAAAAGVHDFGSDRQTSQQALVGVRQVSVQVFGFEGEVERYGVNGMRARQDAEQRLRQAGFEIISPEEAAHSPNAAVVAIELHTVVNDYGIYSYATDLQLRQKIPLAGATGAYFTETVWSHGTNGWVKPFELQRVDGEISAMVDALLRDHATQNRGNTTY